MRELDSDMDQHCYQLEVIHLICFLNKLSDQELYLSYGIASIVGMDVHATGFLGELSSMIFVLVGTAMGAGIGFGYGSALLLVGNHPYNMLHKFLTGGSGGSSIPVLKNS